MRICIDPGHGMGNRAPGKYDPGACFGEYTEAGIVMEWANELRAILQERGHFVVRSRIDAKDSAPVIKRAEIARQYGCEILVSLHCNAATGNAHGTETFYRGDQNADMAAALNLAVVGALNTRNRGIKTEQQSQHTRLAVMSFQPAFLIELGFIDNAGDLHAMTDPNRRRAACLAIADAIEEQ